MPNSSAASLRALGDCGDYLASFVDGSPDCIQVLDLDGRIEFMNERGLTLLEIDGFDQIRSQRWPSLWPAESSALVTEALKLAVSGETRSFRAFCPTAKGVSKWWDTVVSPVFSPDAPKPHRLLARSRDVTEEVETRSFLDTIIQLVPAGLFAKDAESGRFVLVNQAAENILGYSAEAMVGKTDHDIFPKVQADLFREADLKVIRSGGQMIVEEEEVTTGAGDVRWFRTKKIGLQGVCGARHVLALAEDVTQARAAAETLRQALGRAEAASRAKSEFLATMSHEIRTPLNGLLGMAQAMQARELTIDQRDRLKIIRRSGETLLAILNDILDISKIEAGVLELELTDFDMEHLVRGAITAFAALADKKGVSFAFVVEESARTVFNGDGARIRRVLYSLLSNAVKFTDAGQIHVSVGYHGGKLRIAVSDTGVGIAPELMPTLFETFVQGDPSSTRRFGGSGLGLAICRGLVQLMGGSIEVKSTLGQGSVFEIALPLARASEILSAPSPTAADQTSLPAKESAGVRVLAAEDNEVNRLVLKTLLQQGGVEPVLVNSGLKALEAWEREPWDVVLMDIQMPEMDGVTATREIRMREAITGRTRTPIIAVTANAMTHQIQAYYAAGMDDVVSKPLDIMQLFSALERVLDASQTGPARSSPAEDVRPSTGAR